MTTLEYVLTPANPEQDTPATVRIVSDDQRLIQERHSSAVVSAIDLKTDDKLSFEDIEMARKADLGVLPAALVARIDLGNNSVIDEQHSIVQNPYIREGEFETQVEDIEDMYSYFDEAEMDKLIALGGYTQAAWQSQPAPLDAKNNCHLSLGVQNANGEYEPRVTVLNDTHPVGKAVLAGRRELAFS